MRRGVDGAGPALENVNASNTRILEYSYTLLSDLRDPQTGHRSSATPGRPRRAPHAHCVQQPRLRTVVRSAAPAGSHSRRSEFRFHRGVRCRVLDRVRSRSQPRCQPHRTCVPGPRRLLRHHRVEVLAGAVRAFRWLDHVVLDLHFDVCAFQPAARPGRWRTTAVAVTAPSEIGLRIRRPRRPIPSQRCSTRSSTGWQAPTTPTRLPIILAAMAHLHLVSIHPFRDGNGRLARVLQALVLARGTGLPAELCSIEGSLAANTAGYYAALTTVQGGKYQPDRDARSWIDFCVGRTPRAGRWSRPSDRTRRRSLDRSRAARRAAWMARPPRRRPRASP